MADELEELLVDGQTVARDDLARVLRPYIRFTSSGGLILEPAFDQLPAEHRVLCALLALQGLHLLELRDSAEATPAEIVELTGMAAGTVRPKLAALLKSRKVAKDGSRYSLPLHSARRVIDLLGRDHE